MLETGRKRTVVRGQGFWLLLPFLGTAQQAGLNVLSFFVVRGGV